MGTSPAAQAAEKLEAVPPPAASSSQSGSGWGWGSVWSQASSIVQQARNVAEEVRASVPLVPVEIVADYALTCPSLLPVSENTCLTMRAI